MTHIGAVNTVVAASQIERNVAVCFIETPISEGPESDQRGFIGAGHRSSNCQGDGRAVHTSRDIAHSHSVVASFGRIGRADRKTGARRARKVGSSMFPLIGERSGASGTHTE